MQAQFQLMTPTRQMLITAAVVVFLAVMAMVPAARAMSLVPAGELVTEEASAQPSASSPGLTAEQIQLLEENWVFGGSDGTADDNPAAVEPSLSTQDRVDQINELRSQNVADFEAMERAPGLYTDSSIAANVADFEAMERAPGLYTDSSDAASPAGDASAYAGLSHDEMKFLHDNWHLGPGIFIEDEDVADTARGNPSLSRDDIQFLEDNWYFDAAALVQDDEAIDDESESRALTREEIQFNEDNWNFNTGDPLSGDDTDETASVPTSGNNTDRADTLNGLRNGAGDAGAGRSHDELTYPWGGFREHDH